MSDAANLVELRDARLDDTAAIAGTWYRGWQDGHLGHVPDALVTARTAESFAARAAERIGDTRIAIFNQQPVGFTMVTADEVEQIYVADAARGTGIAGILLADAERHIADAGYETAWLAV